MLLCLGQQCRWVNARAFKRVGVADRQASPLPGANAGDAVLAVERVFFALISTDRTAKYDEDIGRDCVNVPGTIDSGVQLVRIETG
jgi:hypothetical protein